MLRLRRLPPTHLPNIPDWFSSGLDKNTRVAFFAWNLRLNPGELPGGVTVRFTPIGGAFIVIVRAEDVRAIPNSEFTQVVVRLPANLTPGTYIVQIAAHTRVSNTGTIRIAP